MSNLVQQSRAQQQRGKTIQQMLAPIQSSLNNALAERIGVERFMQAAVTTFRNTPGLARCTEDSILGGLFTAAQLGLEVGGPRGLCYLVPYGQEATFVLGYRGLVELFYRTGQITKVDAFLIREGDRFERKWDLAHGRVFDWAPGGNDEAPWVGVVAYVLTRDGEILWEHLTKAEVLKRRPTKWTKGPWETWEEQMVLKTGLKALQRTVRQSTDDRSLQFAITADETVQRRVSGVEEHVVERVPVQGELPVAAGPEPDETPMALDEEAAFEEQSRREHDAWVAAQEGDS